MFPVRGAVARSRECAAVLFRKDSGALLERFLARNCVDDRIRSLARSFSDLQDVASCLLLPPGARVGRLPLIVEVHLGMVPRCEARTPILSYPNPYSPYFLSWAGLCLCPYHPAA